MRSFQNDFEFMTAFPDEEACITYLEHKRWNGNPQCPKCNNNSNNYILKNRKSYKCSNCRCQFSLTKNTIFENSKLSLRVWFFVIYYVLTDNTGISSYTIAKKVGIQQRSAWLMLSKIRETMRDENMEAQLSGIIEVDETWIGGKPNRDLRLRKKIREHKKKKAPGEKGYEHLRTVSGFYERYTKKIALRKIGWDRSCLTNQIANSILKKHVNTISTIVSDGDKGYSKVKEHFHSHWVIVKDKSIKKKRKDGSIYYYRFNSYVNHKVHVNGIESVWRHLKNRFIPTFVQITYKHLDRYLDEFSFKWNRKDTPISDVFEETIGNSIGKTLTYKELIPWRHEYQRMPWAA